MLKAIVDKAVSRGVTFAVCLMPGDDNARYFIDGDSTQTGTRFVISPWLAPWDSRLTIGRELSADTFASYLDSMPFTPTPTADGAHVTDSQITRDAYLAAVSRVIGSCRRRHGKTVFSRSISSTLADGTTAGTIFSDLCREFPQTFRFIFHTPATGLWLGATPELLLDHDLTTRRCRVMSLAGTRPQTAADTPWDNKNLCENRFVTDFITGTFASLGAEATVGPRETLRYGRRIEHICHTIEATLPEGTPTGLLIDRLNPTPALCGTPREDAIADIRANELHDRRCYGGAVGLVTDSSARLYVTLRCCRIAGNTIEAIAGGGITPDSDPETEWRESTAKASFYTRYMTNTVSQPRYNWEKQT